MKRHWSAGASAAMLASACIAGMGAGTAHAEGEPGTGTAITYQSAGWSYRQVAHGAEPGFEQPGFDASAWSTGSAGFGTTGGPCEWNSAGPVATTWDASTDILLRHPLSFPATASSAHISGTVDNDADVYLNGHLLQHVASGSCTPYAIQADVPLADLHTPDLLAVRGTDLGGATFLDLEVTYTFSDSPATTPLPAGVFSAVQADATAVPPAKAVSNSSSCTTGFAVSKGESTYVLTANHCREWTGRKGRGLRSDASVVNVRSGDSEPAMTWASKLSCDVSTDRCLRPSAPAPADLMAWAPDPGTVTPSGEVMTAHGLQPVVGTQQWKKGMHVCRMGAQTAVEKCGTVGYLNPHNGFVYIRHGEAGVALAGDSGGPVYTYALDGEGAVVGVKAVGILERSTRTRSYFYPIGTALAGLGVDLVIPAGGASS